jgi:putative redox protein
MDAKTPIGTGKAATPKELVLSAICGCSGMDVMSMLRKFKQSPQKMHIEAEAELATSHPAVFTRVNLVFDAEGAIDESVLVDAVKKSMTEYCSVSAMIAKSCPIHYTVKLNSKEVTTGQASF